MIMTDKEKHKAQKELEKFKKDYDKLMSKYPQMFVGCSITGEPYVHHMPSHNQVSPLYIGK
jgi:hypothetical protein